MIGNPAEGVVAVPPTQTRGLPANRPADVSSSAGSRLDSLLTSLLAPVDVASLVVFRIGFGLMMAGWTIDYLTSGRVQDLYVGQRFHFTYYLLDFVRPWPGPGMYLHFVALLVFALCIAAGFLYRVSTVLFAAGLTYVFLLDRTTYQNHYYLLLLVSWVLAVLPLNRAAAVDALEGFARPSPTVPTWCLWLARFHIALPYVFGGVAKFHPDWFAGEPMRTHLASNSGMPVIGPYLTSEWTIACFVWGGLLFDLGIVPLLLWRPTRAVAYVLCVLFHLMNSVLFSIHVFPWFMICATTLFFEPDWPRRLFGLRRLVLPPPSPVTWNSVSRGVRWVSVLISFYCAFHLAWPLRHHLYAGDSVWTERGHYFSWRMMLRGKVSAVRYYLTDPATGNTRVASLRPYLNIEQVSKFSRDPEMILHLAHFLAEEHRAQTGRPVEVRALVLTSLNGRKPQLLVDPNVDLAKEPRGFHFRSWILSQNEPLRPVAWSVPMQEWERHVELPPLTFLQPQQPDRPHKTSTPSVLGTSRLLPQRAPPVNEVRRS